MVFGPEALTIGYLDFGQPHLIPGLTRAACLGDPETLKPPLKNYWGCICIEVGGGSPLQGASIYPMTICSALAKINFVAILLLMLYTT